MASELEELGAELLIDMTFMRASSTALLVRLPASLLLLRGSSLSPLSEVPLPLPAAFLLRGHSRADGACTIACEFASSLRVCVCYCVLWMIMLEVDKQGVL